MRRITPILALLILCAVAVAQNGYRVKARPEGGVVQVAFLAPAGSPATDRVDLFAFGAPNNQPLQSHFTGGLTYDVFLFASPPPGGYECRYLLGGTFVSTASFAFTVP